MQDKKSQITYIDPPFGWKYGFPKEFTLTLDGTSEEKTKELVYKWLVENGYPEEELFDNMPIRIYDAEDNSLTVDSLNKFLKWLYFEKKRKCK